MLRLLVADACSIPNTRQKAQEEEVALENSSRPCPGQSTWPLVRCDTLLTWLVRIARATAT